MAAGDTAQQELRTALNQLIARRARIGLCILAAGIVLFSVISHVGSSRLGLWSDALNGLGLVLIALMFALLSRPAVQDRPVPLALVGVGLLCVLRTLGGIWGDDVVPTVLTGVTLALVAGGTMPWGVRAQLASAAMVGAAIAINASVVLDGSADAHGRAAANVVTALGASVVLAYELRRNHLRWFAEIFERRRTQDELARLNAELERRVGERTAELQRAEERGARAPGRAGARAAPRHHGRDGRRPGARDQPAARRDRQLRPGLRAPAARRRGRRRRAAADRRGDRRRGAARRRDHPPAARPGAQGRRRAASRLDLNDLVRDVGAPDRAGGARAHGVAVQLELAPDRCRRCTCNDIQIEQVVLNLLLNGVEAVARQRATAQRALPVRTAPPAATPSRSTVRDTGVGLPEPPADVFAPFFTTKAERPRHGPVDQPLDHRSARRPPVARAQPRARQHVPLHAAGESARVKRAVP